MGLIQLGSCPFQPKDRALGPFFGTNGLALRSYDPVAYFIDDKPVKGSPEYEWEWGGVTWRFATADNRERFRNNPERFAPRTAGFVPGPWPTTTFLCLESST